MYTIINHENQSKLTIRNIKVYNEECLRGNPYNTMFDLEVVSGNFSGIVQFEYDIKNFIVFIKEIADFYEFKIPIVKLKDICYGSFVLFEMDKKGQIEISGIIFGEASQHSLEFCFKADQTMIEPFLKPLYKDYIIESVHLC